MKRILCLLILFFLFPTPAQADSHTIYLTSIPNSNYQGVITNKALEKSLAPDGELGKLIYQLPTNPRTWVIDASLVEDVQTLADKKSLVAQDWLKRLKRVLPSGTVYATAYGNPDVIYLRSLAPSELNFYYQIGQERLQAALGISVRSEQGSGYSYQRAKIGRDIREFFTAARQDYIDLATVVDPKEIEVDRAKMAQLFNAKLTDKERQALLSDFLNGESEVISKLRIVNGRYRITTANQKMPITLVNEFKSPVKVDLLFTPINNRVVFPQYRQITLNASSKTQVSVPIKTIAPGDVIVIARFENGKGKVVGSTGMLELSSTIISPAITRFTTGAGVVLILAAIAQSVRRVRRNRKQ